MKKEVIDAAFTKLFDDAECILYCLMEAKKGFVNKDYEEMEYWLSGVLANFEESEEVIQPILRFLEKLEERQWRAQQRQTLKDAKPEPGMIAENG